MWRRPLSRQLAPLDYGPQCTSPISAFRSPDALPSREEGLFHSSPKFTEEQSQGWELNIHLGRERSASLANVTVQGHGPLAEFLRLGSPAAPEPPRGAAPWARSGQRDPPSWPSWSFVSARFCSCPVTSGVLGHPELQKLKLKSNLCRSCRAPLTRQNVAASGLRRQATMAGEAGGAPAPA